MLKEQLNKNLICELRYLHLKNYNNFKACHEYSSDKRGNVDCIITKLTETATAPLDKPQTK